MRDIEAQERVADRHGEVAGGIVFVRLNFKLGRQYFVDLRVQYFNRVRLRARQFFLQRNGILEPPDFLQGFYRDRNRARVVDQFDESRLNPRMAEESIHLVKQGQPKL